MKCFYHHDAEAIAVCKSCSRGLCPACAADVGNGLACLGHCEEEVRAINRVIERNKTAYEKTSGAYLRMAAFYLALGAVVSIGGVIDWRGYGWLLLPAGAVFLLSSVLHFSTARRFQQG